MNLSELAGKQKRVRDWLEFAQNSVNDPELKVRITAETEAYQKLITQIWRAGAVSPSDAQQVRDRERVLQELNEEARLRVGPCKTGNTGKPGNITR